MVNLLANGPFMSSRLDTTLALIWSGVLVYLEVQFLSQSLEKGKYYYCSIVIEEFPVSCLNHKIDIGVKATSFIMLRKRIK